MRMKLEGRRREVRKKKKKNSTSTSTKKKTQFRFVPQRTRRRDVTRVLFYGVDIIRKMKKAKVSKETGAIVLFFLIDVLLRSFNLIFFFNLF